MDEDKPIDLTKEVDREETFEMFIQYIYTCKYQVPSHFDTADICRLHARVYVLADQFLMDVLKRFALTKMTSMLKEDDEWSSSVNLSPEVIQQLVEIVYDGTKDKQRWFDAIGETATNPLESTDMGSGQGSVALKENEDHVGPNPANTNDINKDRESQDGMRSLLSGYAASKLDTLRENALFMKGLTDGGQFVADLIMALSFEDEGRFVYDGFGDFNSYAKGKRVKKSKRKQTEHAVWG